MTPLRSIAVSRVARTAFLLAAVLVAGCESTGPDHRENRLPVGAVVAGRVASANDTAVYVADVNAGDTIMLFLEVESGGPSDVLMGELYSEADGRRLRWMDVIHTPNSAIDETGTTWMVVPPGGRILVRVYRANGASRIPFRVMLGRPGRGPETRGAEISLDQVVAGESFAFRGEPDEYRFNAAAGDQLIVYYRPTGGAAFPARGAVLGPAGFDEGLAFAGASSSLDANPSHRVYLHQAGEYRLLLLGDAPTNNIPVPYEFRISRATP